MKSNLSSKVVIVGSSLRKKQSSRLPGPMLGALALVDLDIIYMYMYSQFRGTPNIRWGALGLYASGDYHALTFWIVKSYRMGTNDVQIITGPGFPWIVSKPHSNFADEYYYLHFTDQGHEVRDLIYFQRWYSQSGAEQGFQHKWLWSNDCAAGRKGST